MCFSLENPPIPSPVIDWKQPGNTAPIRRAAVRETGVSPGIMGDQLKAPLKSLGPSQHCRIAGFEGGLIWVPHYAKRRQSFFQSQNLYICIGIYIYFHKSGSFASVPSSKIKMKFLV